MSIRVLVVDDNEVARLGLQAMLAKDDRVQVVGEAANGRVALDEAARLSPDVVLLDVRMPVMDGISAAQELAADCRILMLTYSDEDDVVTAAIRAGAAGYLVYGDFEPERLVESILTVAAGGSVLSDRPTGALFDALRGGGVRPPRRTTFGLTPREIEVMDLVAHGLSNREIAEELYVSHKTVKNHINSVFAKLDVTTRTEAVARWLGVAE